MKRYLTIAITAAILLSACASHITTPAPLPTPGEKWMVKMTQSGGIMGLARALEVSSDGGATVTDENAQKKITLQLPDGKLVPLNELIASPDLTQPVKSLPACADCFIYNIEITSTAGKPFTATVNDISLPDSGLEPLVIFLRDMMDTALKK